MNVPVPPATGIPRLTYLGRVLQLCFFPVLTVFAGVIVFWVVPQAREALHAFGDEHRISEQAFFELAFVLWLLSAWYVARLLVGKRFEPDLIGSCISASFAQAVALWLPRALALIAGIAVTWLIARDTHQWGLVALLAVTCAVTFGLLVFRRQIGRLRNQRWVQHWHRRPQEDFERFDSLAPSAWYFIGFLAFISAALLIALPVGMESIARPVGSPALLLFALMSWTIFGGFVLTYLPKSYHLPVLTWIVALLAIAFSRCNENHVVAPPVAGIRNSSPAPLKDVFAAWLQNRKHPEGPVILIATAGGASRAAYWTTSALGMLQDESPSFADNVFLISGISGGSVGAVAFVTSLDLVRSTGGNPCRSVRNLGNEFTGKDDLATVMGMLLFPDLFQRLWFRPIEMADRSRGLEEIWVRDWNKIMEDCDPEARPHINPWSEAFTALNANRTAESQIPALALSSTALRQGRPVMQATFSLPRGDMAQLLPADPTTSLNLETASLTLTQAAHNSARFPYVSPAGRVIGKDGNLWDRLGDGGYIEASGSLVLAEVITELETEGLLRSGETCVEVTAAAQHPCLKVLVLDNSATKKAEWLCSADDKANPADEDSGISTGSVAHWLPLPDLLAPLQGAFSARGGRALSAQVDLLRLVGGCGDHFAEIRLPSEAKQIMPSMSWMLDSNSRMLMDNALNKPSPGSALEVNLNRIRGWLK